MSARGIRSPLTQTCNEPPRNSRSWCLWPVTAQVRNQRVILIPDDSLHTVPFALLPWSADKDAQLFIERAELSVMPSTLFVTHPRPQAAGRVAAPRFELIGDPVFRASDWRRECAREGDDSATATTESTSASATAAARAQTFQD